MADYLSLALTDADKALIGATADSPELDPKTGLIKKISASISTQVALSDPLISTFKGPNVPLGGYIEEYNFESLAQAKDRDTGSNAGHVAGMDEDYDPDANPWTTKRAKSISVLHKIDRDKTWTFTLDNDRIFQSFSSAAGLSSYVAEWMLNMNNKVFLHDYAWAQGLINKYVSYIQSLGNAPEMKYASTVDRPDFTGLIDEAGTNYVLDILYRIGYKASRFAMPSDLFNHAHRDTQSKLSDLVLILTPELAAEIPFALKGIYNPELVNTISSIKKVVVTAETLTFTTGGVTHVAECLLVDKAALRISDARRDVTSIVNPKARTTSFFPAVVQYNYYRDDINAFAYFAKDKA